MVENPLTINLEVLLSVLYSWRCLEATGRIRLKARGRRLKPKTWEHQRTHDYREYWVIRDHSKASIPTLKPTTAQEPISFRARRTTQILQQRRNIALNVNIQAAQSHTKDIDPSQNSLLNTPLHSREKKSSSMHQNTNESFPNQETLTSQSSNPTHWEKPPQWKGTTDHQKREKPVQTQQSKQDEKTEKHPAGKGTWKMPTKPNRRGGNWESTWKRIYNNDNKNDPISWKQNGVTDK